MDYTQPVGAAPDAGYSDGDPATGTEGSYVPAAAIEAPQREIVHVITQAGLTPDGADLTQLWQALDALYMARLPEGANGQVLRVVGGVPAWATTIIDADTTLAVPGTYADIHAALAYLNDKWIAPGATVTISVAAGHYTYGTAILARHPCGARIKIVGAATVDTTITSHQSASGATGAWDHVLNVGSTAGMAADDHVLVAVSDLANHAALANGCWRIVAINSATRITVRNTYRGAAWPVPAIAGGTVRCLKTVITFTGADGILADQGHALGLADRLALVGDGSAHFGVLAQAGAAVSLGTVGVNGFGKQGIDASFAAAITATTGGLMVSNCTLDGVLSAGGAAVVAAGASSTGHGGHGWLCFGGGTLYAPSSFGCGNAGDGYRSDSGGAQHVPYLTAWGNVGYGVHAVQGAIDCQVSVVQYSQSAGIWAEGGAITATGASAINNTANQAVATKGGRLNISGGGVTGQIAATTGGWVTATGLTGAPTFSPAANTLGNENGYIDT